ncbi:MAG: TetR/AcrR family transcriptional regulator [Castellaniella sp.]|uniref:TetR/AcrR family transcriptional regulator n=1 Tax=Castellaniella sp. TaxID=1955812 RepID=UPI003C761857
MAHTKHSNYHHGDARNALLAAAAALLEQSGAQGLSLRQVAHSAGLSRQAPYNHFVNKEALLAELARAGLQKLQAELLGIADYPAGDDVLQHAAETYIGFAQKTPALFRLMFSRELADPAQSPELASAGAAAYRALADIIQTITAPAPCDDLSLAAWSIVHGYATLCIETGLEDAAYRTQRARQFAHLIHCAATPLPIPNRGDGGCES